MSYLPSTRSWYANHFNANLSCFIRILCTYLSVLYMCVSSFRKPCSWGWVLFILHLLTKYFATSRMQSKPASVVVVFSSYPNKMRAGVRLSLLQLAHFSFFSQAPFKVSPDGPRLLTQPWTIVNSVSLCIEENYTDCLQPCPYPLKLNLLQVFYYLFILISNHLNFISCIFPTCQNTFGH